MTRCFKSGVLCGGEELLLMLTFFFAQEHIKHTEEKEESLLSLNALSLVCSIRNRKVKNTVSGF